MNPKKIVIPKIGLGTWNIKSEELEKIIPEAIKIGYRLFDTARKYSNEEGVGQGIRNSGVARENIFLTTKLWRTDFLRTNSAFKASLERLNTDYIDLYLIHWPFFFWTKAWASMENLLGSGKVKNIGVSNFGIKELEIIKKRYKFKPSVNQIEFSPFYYKKDLLDYCHNEGIHVEAYSPLTRGYRLDDPKIQKIAAKYSKTVPQIMLAWSLTHGLTVLPKSTSVEHLKDNWQAQFIDLSEEDVSYLDSLNENYSALSTFWRKIKT